MRNHRFAKVYYKPSLIYDCQSHDYRSYFINKINIMTTITYEQIQTQNLISISFDSIVGNFKTVDAFMRNFTTFQRKFNDMEKLQKATALDLSNFKTSTTNSFSTMNEVLDSRGNISKGNTKGLQEDMTEAKKSIKELKLFVTESTRDLNINLQAKEKETQQVYKNYDNKIKQLNTFRENDRYRIESLEAEVYNIKSKYTTRLETENLKDHLLQTNTQIQELKQQMISLNDLLDKLGVRQFKEHLDKMEKQLYTDMDDLKVKFKLKTDISDTLKLEDMLLNMISFTYENVSKKYANKSETKKALVFLQKKVNSLIQNIFSEQQSERDGLIAAKGWKCISCTKDLGEFEGKLDRYKAWSVFPAKQQSSKQKYSGFGTGFQNIIETVVTKKGGDISYDDKGRMTTPFNLTRQVQGSGLKNNPSQGKLSKGSPVKQQPNQSNYMNLFGRNSEIDIDVRAQYMQQQKGLVSTIKQFEIKQIK